MYDAERIPDYLHDFREADPVYADPANEVIEHDVSYDYLLRKMDESDARLNWRRTLACALLALGFLLLIVGLFGIFSL